MRFFVVLSVCLQLVYAASEGTSVIVIQKQSANEQPPAQNFTKTTNGTEFPLLQTEAPETVPSSSLVLETTATKNSLHSSADTEKPTTKNVITIQTIESTEKLNDESSTDYAREESSSSTPNGTVVVINLTTVDGNATTTATTTTELNLIPPANVNSSIAFVNETRKNSQIIIRYVKVVSFS